MGHRFIEMVYGGFDQDSFIKTLIGVVNGLHGHPGAVFVMEATGKVVGAVGMVSAPKWFNHSILQAQEMFWWVDEDHRGSRDSFRLFKRVEQWADEIGAQEIVVASTAKIEPERFERFYRKLGYERRDIYYLKELRPCQNPSSLQ